MALTLTITIDNKKSAHHNFGPWPILCVKAIHIEKEILYGL